MYDFKLNRFYNYLVIKKLSLFIKMNNYAHGFFVTLI